MHAAHSRSFAFAVVMFPDPHAVLVPVVFLPPVVSTTLDVASPEHCAPAIIGFDMLAPNVAVNTVEIATPDGACAVQIPQW
jgi:hypothetical protein